MSTPAEAIWQQAEYALAAFAVAPHELGGVWLHSAPGPVRDHWLALMADWLPDTPGRRLPLSATESRLLGGIDLAATLKYGKPVAEAGMLAECHDNVIILPMAERANRTIVAHLCAALDAGEVNAQREGIALCSPARFGVVALDESLPDEAPHPALTERLSLYADLTTVGIRDVSDARWNRDSICAARTALAKVVLSDAQYEAIAAASLMLGVASPRAIIHTTRIARVLAALAGTESVSDEHIALAVQLALGHRANRMPSPEPEEERADDSADNPDNTEQRPPPENPETSSAEQSDEDDTPKQPLSKGELSEQVLESAQAALPAGLLEQLSAQLHAQKNRPNRQHTGKSGVLQRTGRRGRPMGTIPGDPRRGQRLSVIATLRAAVPWQGLRRREQTSEAKNLDIRKEDFRVTRYRQRTESTTLFVVDASGSAAMHRLGEAKGAVELLLAECYVRRDEVALIAFRGEHAEVLLPPTRSLVRAKRCLAGLPGGGGTPLGHAIELTDQLAQQIQRKGATPGLVFLTDGVANISRDGTRGRGPASEDALNAANALAQRSFRAIVIDTSPRAQTRASDLARAMGAGYLPMPNADATRLRDAVQRSGIQG